MGPTIKLKVPLDLPEQDGAAEIVFTRRMNAGDLIAVGFTYDMSGAAMDVSLSADQIVTVASRCTGIPKAILAQLDAVDWGELVTTVSGFFVLAPLNG